MTDDPRPGFNALRDKMLQHLEVHRAAKLEDLAQAAATFAYEALYLPGSPDAPHVQRTAPRRIYLCVSDDLDDRDEPFSEVRAEVTWARDEAARVAVPYVRADLANAGTAVADERAAFEAWAADHWPNAGPPDNAWQAWQARAALAAPKAEAPMVLLRRLASIVQGCCHDNDFVLISGDTLRIGDLLDEANVLLAPPAHQGATP